MLLLLFPACAPADTSPTTWSVTSDAGLYAVRGAVTPDPPSVGASTLEVWADGADSLSLDGGMAGMGHGFSEDPIVTSVEDGHWLVDMNCPMSGTWDLELSLDGPPGPDTAGWSVEIE